MSLCDEYLKEQINIYPPINDHLNILNLLKERYITQ